MDGTVWKFGCKSWPRDRFTVHCTNLEPTFSMPKGTQALGTRLTLYSIAISVVRRFIEVYMYKKDYLRINLNAETFYCITK